MKTVIALVVATIAAGCMAGPLPEPSADTRAAIDAELAGRVAEPAMHCVNQRDLRGNRSAGDAILFEGRGRLVYLNRPAGGCPSLRFGRALKTSTTSTKLCEGDIVTVFDPVSGIEYGGCGLGEFVPYRRAARR